MKKTSYKRVESVSAIFEDLRAKEEKYHTLMSNAGAELKKYTGVELKRYERAHKAVFEKEVIFYIVG